MEATYNVKGQEMICDNCDKDIGSEISYYISSSEEVLLLQDNGGKIKSSYNNKVCYDCMAKATKLLVEKRKREKQ